MTFLFHDKKRDITHTANETADLCQKGKAVLLYGFILIHDHDVIKEMVDGCRKAVASGKDAGKITGKKHSRCV